MLKKLIFAGLLLLLLKLDHLYLVHPHEKTFPIAENMTALGIDSFYKPIA